MALASQLTPLLSSAPPPTMEGFAFVQIGKPPSLLSRLGDGSAALDASTEGSSDQSLADDDDMYAPEDPQAPPADIQMQDAFASNPGAPGSRSLLSRMDPSVLAPVAAPADNILPSPTPDAPASSTAADISVADQQPPSQVVPGPPAPPVTSSSNAGQTVPEPQAPAELSAIRSLFSSLTAFKIPIPDGIAQLVHTLTTETTSVSTSAHKAVASAQEALKCAQISLEAAQASLASAGSLEAKCREVTDALERLSKENALKKQAWDKMMKETVCKGEKWAEAKEKEDAEMQQKQQLLREQNDKLANAARHFKTLATQRLPAIVTNGQSDSSAIHYPAHMPSPVREEVEAFAKQQLQAYQDEEQAKYLEKEKDLEDLLRKHQEEVERLASEREQLRKQREQSRLRISGQSEGGSAEKGKGTSPTASQSPSARSQHAPTSSIAGGTQHSLAAASSVASQPAAHNVKASQPSGIVAPVTMPLVSKNDSAQHEASLRKKLKVRTSLGGDRHDNKSMSNSPISPPGAAFLYPDSASGSPQAQILASPTTNGPEVASSGTAALVAGPSLAHRPVPPSLPAEPVAGINASQTRQQVLGMPTPLPSPNASLEAIKGVAMTQPPSPTDSTLGKTLSKRQAKKMRKASQQSLGSDSSQMTVNHHGSDAGNLSLQPSPTLPTVPFIQELSARRSSAECLMERASMKSEPMEASLPKEGSTQPKSKVKAEPQASPVVPPQEAGQAPAGAGARLPLANSTTEATDQLPALPPRRKAGSQPQAKAGASNQIVPSASQPAAVATPAQSIVLAEPARPAPPTSGPLSYERPAGVPYSNHQSGGQHSVQRGPPSRGRPDGGRSQIRSDSRRQRDTWQPVGDESYTRPSHDHWSPPPYAYRQSPPPRRDVRDYDHRGARSRSPGPAQISRKRSLDEHESAAMMRNARRPRYDDEPPVAYSSSGGTIATMGDHDIDMNDLPPRPPMRNPRSRNPSGEHRGWHIGGVDHVGSSSALRPSLENRIEQADAPRPAHFMDRLADAPMAESLVQDQVEFQYRTHSPASEQGDRAPLKYRLSNPSRGRGAKRGGRGGGRGGGYGGKNLASRIRLDTPNGDYERE